VVAEIIEKMTKMKLLTNQAYWLTSYRRFAKLFEDKRILFLKPAVKPKMLTFVLPTEMSLEVSFWTFFQISQQPMRIRKNRNHQIFLLMQGYLSKVKLDNSLFSFDLDLLHLLKNTFDRKLIFAKLSPNPNSNSI